MNDMIINIAIVDDKDEIREGLSYLINSSEGFKCAAKYSNAEDALKEIPTLNIDVVLMDINLPGMSGIDCVIELKRKRKDIQIMMLTIFEDGDMIFKSLQAGASGYVLKKTSAASLLEAIKDIYNGGSPMSSQIARKVVASFQSTKVSLEKNEELSDRETEILTYLSKGYRYKEIAELLFISIETVRTHIRNIYEKLQVHSRTEAILKVQSSK
ncbi:MAG: response regulator [Ignavibacteriaceae bacterium]